MYLYLNKKGKLAQIDETKKDLLEKDIQTLTENNLKILFNLEFLATEYTLEGFRVDTIAFDPEDYAFVIIEYKRDKSFSVSDQGLSYLSLIHNNRANLVLLYNKLNEKNQSIEDFDWKRSRVILIAHEFTPHQLHALRFKDLPIELWEVSIYGKSFVGFNQVKIPHAEESLDALSKSTEIKKISSAVASPSVDELVNKIENQQAKDRAKEIMEYCEGFDGAIQYTTRGHIVYKKKQAFAKVYPQKEQFWVDVRWVKNDPYKLLRHKHPIFGHIRVENDLDLSKVKDLIKQSYEMVF